MNKIEFWRLYNRKTDLILKNRNLLYILILLLVVECTAISGILFLADTKYVSLWIMSILVSFYLPLLILSLWSLFLYHKKEIKDIMTKYNSDEKIDV
jgi:hypothetical protein